jgi:CDP-diacylglycerol pyrophosphatase
MQERKKLRKSGRAGRTWRAALPDAQGIARKDWVDGRERGRAPFRLAWSEGCAVRVCLVFAAGVIALTAFATWAFALDRQALWSVVNACVADHKLTRAPFPCLKVDLGGGKERGYVVLYAPFERDTILAPTRKIVGVEDPYLQSSAAPNYFADAWEAWLNLNGERGRSPDLGFALVVNSALARSQDQLHIHMGCLAPSARSALDAAAPRLAIGEWSPIGPLVPHQPFWAFRTGTADLGPETMGTATKVWHPCRCAKADRGAP